MNQEAKQANRKESKYTKNIVINGDEWLQEVDEHWTTLAGTIQANYEICHCYLRESQGNDKIDKSG